MDRPESNAPDWANEENRPPPLPTGEKYPSFGPGRRYVDDQGREIIEAEVVPESTQQAPQRRPRLGLPLLLFLGTCVSTFLVGTGLLPFGGRADWWAGVEYAACLMFILVCHEGGHFIQTRRYGVRSSFPFFLPMPFSPIGTFGAVIAMDARIPDRKALFDIGITGPLAGLVPALAFSVIGIYHAEILPAQPHAFELGEPLLFTWLSWLIHGPIEEGYTLYIGSMAYAGWVGLLITALNLFPIGQLDGGHILYALLRYRAHQVAMLLLMGATAAVIIFGLWAWMLMLFLLAWIGPQHPPTANDYVPLGRFRVLLGWLTLAFLVIGFTPDPFPITAQSGEQQQQQEPQQDDENDWYAQALEKEAISTVSTVPMCSQPQERCDVRGGPLASVSGDVLAPAARPRRKPGNASPYSSMTGRRQRPAVTQVMNKETV